MAAREGVGEVTLKELSQLYWLNREIKEDERRLEALRLRRVGVSSPINDGMPHAQEVHSKVEALALAIIELEQIIAGKQAQAMRERVRLERWIAAISDSLTRQVFTARFVEGLSWADVAEYVGGNTEASVKKICYRYLNGRD